LPCAREPDWHVETEWKHHELWWAAEGGDAATTCDPVAEPDCDEPNRSDRWLTDTTDDVAPAGVEPDQLGVEISVRGRGIDLSHRSYIELEDLDILLFEEEGIRITGSGSEDDRCYGLTLTGLDIGWSTRGLHLAHGPEPSTASGSQTRQLTLRDSRVHDMESRAIYFWTGSGEDFVRPGITDVRIFHNEFARIGFRDNEQGGVGMSFGHADHLLFEGNHVHHIAHNGQVRIPLLGVPLGIGEAAVGVVRQGGAIDAHLKARGYLSTLLLGQPVGQHVGDPAFG
jgi:hypothetical protein